MDLWIPDPRKSYISSMDRWRSIFCSVMLASTMLALLPSSLNAQDKGNDDVKELRKRIQTLERANDSLRSQVQYYHQLAEANRKLAEQQEKLAEAKARIAAQQAELAQLRAMQMLEEQEELDRSEAGMAGRSEGVAVNTREGTTPPSVEAPADSDQTFSARSQGINVSLPRDSVDGLNQQILMLSQKLDSLSAEIRRLREE